MPSNEGFPVPYGLSSSEGNLCQDVDPETLKRIRDDVYFGDPGSVPLPHVPALNLGGVMQPPNKPPETAVATGGDEDFGLPDTSSTIERALRLARVIDYDEQPLGERRLGIIQDDGVEVVELRITDL